MNPAQALAWIEKQLASGHKINLSSSDDYVRIEMGGDIYTGITLPLAVEAAIAMRAKQRTGIATATATAKRKLSAASWFYSLPGVRQ